MTAIELSKELNGAVAAAEEITNRLVTALDAAQSAMDEAIEADAQEGIPHNVVTHFAEIAAAARFEMAALAREDLAAAVAYADEVFANLTLQVQEPNLTRTEELRPDPMLVRELST